MSSLSLEIKYSYRTKKGRLKAVPPTGKSVGFPAEIIMTYLEAMDALQVPNVEYDGVSKQFFVINPSVLLAGSVQSGDLDGLDDDEYSSLEARVNDISNMFYDMDKMSVDTYLERMILRRVARENANVQTLAFDVWNQIQVGMFSALMEGIFPEQHEA